MTTRSQRWREQYGRPGWPEWARGVAQAVAQRSTCPRAKVGAVVLNADHHIVATGYNGAPPGEPHCLDIGCDMQDGHCQRSLHAEVNAVAHATASLKGGMLYLWSEPEYDVCRECVKVLKAAGVTW